MPQNLTEGTLIALLLLGTVAMIVLLIQNRVWKAESVLARPQPPEWGPLQLFLCAVVGFITMAAASGMVMAMASFPPQVDPATTGPTSSPVFLPKPPSANAIVASSVIGPAAALLAMLCLLNALDRRSFAWLGFSITDLCKAVIPAIASIAVIVPMTFWAMIFFSWLYGILGLETHREHPLLRVLAQSPQLLPFVAISAVFLAPVVEELLFRGCLQTAIGLALSGSPLLARWIAIALTSIAFVSVHGELWMMPPLFVLSVGLGYAYERTGRLWVPIAVHTAFNCVSMALFVISRK